MRVSRRIVIEGRVQGLGVRPAIARLADRLGVSGRVRNRLNGVEIEVDGESELIEAFEAQLAAVLPARAFVERRESTSIPHLDLSSQRFQIEATPAVGSVRAHVPTDVVMCAECLNDVRDPAGRRFDYPLATCAACGPRFSVITAMPFERSATTLQSFEQCPECHAEYTNPKDRRFHAQTIVCPNCGPHLWCVDGQGHRIASQREALQVAIIKLRAGLIVALRGIGGYQLLCDATSSAAVRRLRDRKRRPSKPLAVMVDSLDVAHELAEISEIEAQALSSDANPIVLLTAKNSSRLALAAEIHPGLRDVGIMLPSSPLHWLIAHHFGRPLVVTSGNVEGEPLVVDVADSESRLATIADLWLHHDRPIANAVDDSVVRRIADRMVTLRLGRGLAPLVLPDWPWKRRSLPAAIATGGHLKNAFALHNGEQAVLGPHVGDLDHEASRQRFLQQLEQMQQLFGLAPRLIAHDSHPNYFTTNWAQRFAATQPAVRLVSVQHHHAHVAAASWEQGWLQHEVIGLAWDGTGFGSDGSIWGGETLRCRGSQFERIGSCRPFQLPGGEVAIREPWRVAAVLLREAVGQTAANQFIASHLPATEHERFFAIAASPKFSPRCSSIGRLFDAVAAMVLKLERSAFEGQPAMLLESLCEPRINHLDFATGDFMTSGFGTSDFDGNLDWRPLVRRVWQDLSNGVQPGQVAAMFHHSLAQFVVATTLRHPQHATVLSGGVFQNRFLVESIVEQMGKRASTLAFPRLIPPNDGGLAAGQLAVAMMLHEGL